MNCGCYSVNASDLATAIIALDGTIATTKKRISAADFFTTKLKAYDMLDTDELVTAVEVPAQEDYQTGYIKDRLRAAIDFALLSLAYSVKMKGDVIEDIRLVFGGVAPVPVRLYAVEEYLRGKKVSAEAAKEAAELSVANAVAMELNNYKIVDAKVMMERLIANL